MSDSVSVHMSYANLNRKKKREDSLLRSHGIPYLHLKIVTDKISEGNLLCAFPFELSRVLSDFPYLHAESPELSRGGSLAAGLGGELARCARKVPTLSTKQKSFPSSNAKQPFSTLPLVPGSLIRCWEVGSAGRR